MASQTKYQYVNQQGIHAEQVTESDTTQRFGRRSDQPQSELSTIADQSNIGDSASGVTHSNFDVNDRNVPSEATSTSVQYAGQDFPHRNLDVNDRNVPSEATSTSVQYPGQDFPQGNTDDSSGNVTSMTSGPSSFTPATEEMYNQVPELRNLHRVCLQLDSMSIDNDIHSLKSVDESVKSSTHNRLPVPHKDIPHLTQNVNRSNRLPAVPGRAPPQNQPRPNQPPRSIAPTPTPRRSIIRPRVADPAVPKAPADKTNTGTGSKKPLTNSQKGTELLRNQGQKPTDIVVAKNKQPTTNKVKKPVTTTVGEGAMDGHGNILADDERDALTQYNLYIQKGKLKEQRDKYSESLTDFKKALQFQIQARGENHPDVARTHGLIGRIHHKAGQHKQAVEQLHKEIDIYETNGYSASNNGTELWQAHDILAQAYDGLRDTQKEIKHYETAIKILCESTMIPPERLPHMHNNVGNAYRNAGKLNEARAHLEDAKEMMMLMHCEDPGEDMAKVHSSLGDVYNDLGLTEQAIEQLEDCIKIRERTRAGPDGALLRGGTHQTLATLYERLGNTDKAQEHSEKSKRGLKGLMGSKEDREAMLQNLAGMVKGHNATGVLGRLAAGLTASEDINKAQAFQAANDNKQAIEHYQKGIESLLQLPEDVRNSEELLSTLALCYNNVGNAYRKTNQWDFAEASLRKALDIRRTLYADEASDDTGSTLFNLGHLLQSIGGRQKNQEAIELHKECLEMYKKLAGTTYGKHKTWIVSLYRGLGVGYERLGNSRKSIEMYEEAKLYLTDVADADELRAVCNNVGNSYESIGDFPKAEENITQALNMAAMQAVDNPDPEIQNHIAAGHNNLGVLYQTWNKLDKALHHLEQSLEIRNTIKDDNMEAAHDVASSHHNIGNTLAKMGHNHRALQHYEQELEIRRNLGSDTTGVRVSMSQVHDKLGNTTRAEELLTDSFK